MNAVGSWHRLCLAESVQPPGIFLLGSSVWKLFSLAALTIPDMSVRWEHFPERFLDAPWSYRGALQPPGEAHSWDVFRSLQGV